MNVPYAKICVNMNRERASWRIWKRGILRKNSWKYPYFTYFF